MEKRTRDQRLDFPRSGQVNPFVCLTKHGQPDTGQPDTGEQGKIDYG